MFTQYLNSIQLAQMTEDDLVSLDPSGYSCSQVIDMITLNAAREVNATPSGNWSDFNRVHGVWELMTGAYKNDFCQELIGDEPLASNYPNLRS